MQKQIAKEPVSNRLRWTKLQIVLISNKNRAHQLWYILHRSFHFQANNLKLNLTLLIHWLLIVLRMLHKFENFIKRSKWVKIYCPKPKGYKSNNNLNSLSTDSPQRINNDRKYCTSCNNTLARREYTTRRTHKTALWCSCLELKIAP